VAGSYFVPEGGGALELAVGLGGGWPAGIGALEPRFLGPDGAEFGGKQAERNLDDVFQKPYRAFYTAPKTTPAFLDLKCELLSAGKLLGAKSLRLYSLAGIRVESQTLETQLK